MKKHTKVFLTEMLLIILICGYNREFTLAFAWIIIHELSHIVAARMVGSKFFNIELHIFGARANLVDLEYINDRQKLWIYLAGPIINIIVVLVLLILSTQTRSNFIDMSIGINVTLAVFNLLPAYPLDGARICEIVFSKVTLYKIAHKIVAVCSYIIATLLILLFFILMFVIEKMNISLVISGILIIYFTNKEKESFGYVAMGNIIKKRKILIKNKYIENKSVSVYYKYNLVSVLGLVERNKFSIFYVLDDDMKLKYILYEDELIDALKLYGNITLEEYINKQEKVE